MNLIRILSVFALSAFVFGATAFAAGAPTLCKVTILKLELKDITGKWVVAFEGEAEANLANQNGPMIEIVNDGSVPAADYANFRVTFAETIVVTGADGMHRTKDGGEAVQTGTAAQARFPGRITKYTMSRPTWSDEALPGPITLTIDYDNGDRDRTMQLYGLRELRRRIPVREGSKIRIWMDFDLSQSVRYAFPDSLGKGVPAQNAMIFEMPQPREASLQADGQSSTFVPNDLAFEF